MLGHRPLAALNEFLNKTAMKELESREYKGEEIIEIVLNDMSFLLKSLQKG